MFFGGIETLLAFWILSYLAHRSKDMCSPFEPILTIVFVEFLDGGRRTNYKAGVKKMLNFYFLQSFYAKWNHWASFLCRVNRQFSVSQWPWAHILQVGEGSAIPLLRKHTPYLRKATAKLPKKQKKLSNCLKLHRLESLNPATWKYPFSHITVPALLTKGWPLLIQISRSPHYTSQRSVPYAHV